MLSAHSILRDRYNRRAAVLDLILLGVSILLCLTTFLDPTILRAIGIGEEQGRIVLGVLSAVAFFVALMQWRVDWRDGGGEHRRAASSLGVLKARCRELRRRFRHQVGCADAEVVAWFNEMDGALVSLKPIPDAQFTVLKACHMRKVEVSRLLDRYPAAPLTVLRLKLWARHVKGLIADKGSSTG
jgi:hypothetical protein